MPDLPTSRLDAWMIQKGVTTASLATQLGVSGATVSRIRHGLQTPSLELALKLENVSGGFILPRDLIPSVPAPRSVQRA